MESELEKFRQEWRQEVQKRAIPEKSKINETRKIDNLEKKLENLPKRVPSSLGPDLEVFHGEEPPTPRSFTPEECDALALFEAAVEREHAGKLSDAVVLYRDAFRANDKVDRLYRDKWFSHENQKKKNKQTSGPMTAPETPDEQEDQNQDQDQDQNQDQNQNQDQEQEQELETKIKTLNLNRSEDVLPADETKYSPFAHSRLPNEIVEAILCQVALLDPRAFVRAQASCKLFHRVAAQSPHIWRALALREYPDQKYDSEAFLQVYGEDVCCKDSISSKESAALWRDGTKWKGQWRAMYMHRPRVRFDGVYVSTCNYVRPGRGDGWSAPMIMVTYYRYLRFFRDGAVLSLLTTDEPKDVVPAFERGKIGGGSSTVRQDGSVFILPRTVVGGTWKHTDSQGSILVHTAGSVPEYEFWLELQVRSSGTRRHNKLKWVTFFATERMTGARTDFGLLNDRPYFFVRYTW
ncbi:uncharacterized protein SAPINGB_P005088 [Magnusiomyces paraingens]|uniref:Uncharacterized protein n=1 Tax=Magnusiomyces paraingens TaxID=2606893 RepID=A0A5E8BXV7_9ASCO|nr:uncharacterized protein SAPINGB_P005088 [Saprochaete ingens]VVT56479.1 unnamed protein product [Saprochaete ingens]